MANEKKVKNKRRLKGIVVSDKMTKTIVVKVTRMKMHSKYRKQYKKRNLLKRYLMFIIMLNPYR